MTATNLPAENILLLQEESKEELIQKILKLRGKVKDLEEVNRQLEDKLQKFESARTREPRRKLKKRWRKLGRPAGHPRVTRHKPEHIDHVIDQKLEQCPHCGQASLNELASEMEEHIQEDIIPARVEAAKFIRHGYWCTHCKKKCLAPYHPNEIPYSYLGPNVLAQTILLKYFHGLPYSKIQSVFWELCSLKVSTSGLAQALRRLAQWLEVEKEVILKALRKSPWVHGDETGWKIAGMGQWLWNFVNQEWAIYQIRRGRGQKEAGEIMSPDYLGVVIRSGFISTCKSLRLFVIPAEAGIQCRCVLNGYSTYLPYFTGISTAS